VLPAAILGSSDFDVTTIDPATVRLRLKGSEDNGVAPLRWALEDVATPSDSTDGKEDCYSDCNTMGSDGFEDLTLKFDTQEVVAALGDFGARECLVLEVTADLIDDQDEGSIIAEDVVLMLKPGPPPKATLIYPTGTINDSTPTYRWSTLPNATWYYLWVNGPKGFRYKKWYKAEDVTFGEVCHVTPDVSLAPGKYHWWIRTYNSYAYGEWSKGMKFTVE
jgi:hypothetical protein